MNTALPSPRILHPVYISLVPSEPYSTFLVFSLRSISEYGACIRCRKSSCSVWIASIARSRLVSICDKVCGLISACWIVGFWL